MWLLAALPDGERSDSKPSWFVLRNKASGPVVTLPPRDDWSARGIASRLGM